MVNVTVHLGFVNTPYTVGSIAAPMRAAKAEYVRKRRRSFSKTRSVETVADILEASYGLVDQFYEKYKDEIDEIISDTFEVTVDILPGDPEETEKGYKSKRHKIFSERMNKFMRSRSEEVEKLFRKFLDDEEAVGEGIPTEVSLKRQRPSFINTGIYRASFRAWIDTK